MYTSTMEDYIKTRNELLKNVLDKELKGLDFSKLERESIQNACNSAYKEGHREGYEEAVYQRNYL
jgi:flagellar biosynthesis/type III secretory pathway protein FliH